MSTPVEPRISVVVPTYRRRASVGRLLGALSAQTLPADQFEIVVSIDGSEDGTRELVAEFAARLPVRALWQPNSGRAAACNAAVRISKGAVVVLLDDDMVPVPGCLAAHLAAHATDHGLGVLGAVPIAFDETSPPIVRYVGENFNAHLDRLAAQGRATKVRDFYSGNFSIERRTLSRVGGFDESFREYGNEDVELAIRLRKSGVELVYSAAAAAWQQYEKSFAQLAHDSLAKGRTAVLCAAKHPELADQMRLGAYRDVPRRWLATRSIALGVARVVPVLPELVIALLTPIERRRRTGLGRYYARAMDFCFWAGARAALRAGPAVRRRASNAGRVDDSCSATGEPMLPRTKEECTSRHADWRFLLGRFAPRAAVCFGSEALEALTACFSATVRTVEAARLRRDCELAVADATDDETLRAMWDVLADGGTCYIEVQRPGIEPLAFLGRRLRAVGFRDVHFFLPRRANRYAAPRAWIPLERLAPSLAITPEMSSSGLARRAARAARRTLRFVAAHLGALDSLVVVARRPASRLGAQHHPTERAGDPARDAGDETLAILSIVREHWRQLSHEPPPERLTLLLNAPGGAHANKLVALVFDAASASPRLVMKLPRSGAAIDALSREAEALRRLHERRPGLRTVPRLLFTHEYDGGLALAQSYVEGVPLWQRLSVRQHETLARKMSEWAVGLVEPDVVAAADQTRIVDSVLAEFQRTFGGVVDRGMFRDACDELTALETLPRTFEQRDFSPWNILVAANGELSVLDWESAEPDGLPVMDLWYGLSYLAFYRSGAMESRRYADTYRTLLDPGTVSGSIAADTLSGYLAATKVSTASVRPLRLLTWMLHSRSEYRQMARETAGSPPPDALRGSIFVGLWTQEMRHAS